MWSSALLLLLRISTSDSSFRLYCCCCCCLYFSLLEPTISGKLKLQDETDASFSAIAVSRITWDLPRAWLNLQFLPIASPFPLLSAHTCCFYCYRPKTTVPYKLEIFLLYFCQELAKRQLLLTFNTSLPLKSERIWEKATRGRIAVHSSLSRLKLKSCNLASQWPVKCLMLFASLVSLVGYSRCAAAHFRYFDIKRRSVVSFSLYNTQLKLYTCSYLRIKISLPLKQVKEWLVVEVENA